MESRSQCFAAFGAREHWLNQLLPMHLPLASWNQEGIQLSIGTCHLQPGALSSFVCLFDVYHFVVVVLNLLKLTL